METAPARQPRISPARLRTRRTMRLALAAVGAVLAASAALLQPFAANHLFPGSSGARHTASPPPSAAIAGPDLPIAPKAVAPSPEERAAAPARREPAAPGPNDVAEPAVATSGSLPSAATTPERPVLGVAPVAAPPQPVTPQAIAAPKTAVSGTAVPVLPPTVSVSAPVPAAAAAVGGTPPPREPLPLQTDLLPPHG